VDHRRLARAAYLLTALTGATGLVYQVAWQRYLARLLGSDSLATATVLGVFLGGLSLGYVIWGATTTRPGNRFLLYGVLEAVIGGWALAFPWLFAAVDAVSDGWRFEPPLGLVLQGTLCAAWLVGPPAVCMGATVPLLTRALSRSLERATGVHARIYAFNTAGAVAGTLGAGFLAIRWLGLPGTVRLAGLANLTAAVFFIAVGLRGAADVDLPERTGSRAPAVPARWVLYAIGCVGGCAFMTLESLVIRLTGLSIGASTYSLSIVIGVFLACIAIGAFLAGRLRSPSPNALLFNQLLACGSLLLVFLTLDDWPYVAHLLRIRFESTLGGFVLYHLAVFASLGLLLAVPVGCLGATLPLAFDALKSRLSEIGRAAGVLFAWNALGNLLGGLVGGFLAYRYFGLGELFLLVAGLAALTGLLAAMRCDRPLRLTAVVVGTAVVLFAWGRPSHDPLRLAVGTFHLREALDYSRGGVDAFYDGFHSGRTVLVLRDDPEATLAVVENPRFSDALRQRFPSLGRSIVAVPSALDEAGPAPRSILINGKPDSSTFYDRETLRLAAHLPALLAERRARVLVIGLGTGVTVGELTLYPDVESIDVAEISSGVVQLLPWFEEWTHAAHADPRLRIRLGDAMRVIRRSGERWDLVISQPSNPWTSGVDQLYSLEFYRSVRAHLEPRGLFLQWVQRYSTNETIAALAVNTLRSEFPYVRVFRTGSDDLLVASAQPLDSRALARAEATIRAHAPIRDSLAEIRVAGAADLTSREHPEVIENAAAFEHLGLETLDRPRIHFLAGIAFFRGDDPDGDTLHFPLQEMESVPSFKGGS
jgi:spermidine synthase